MVNPGAVGAAPDQFRDQLIAASLKQLVADEALPVLEPIPRSIDRGLIEAIYWRRPIRSPTPIPRSIDRGLIEACLAATETMDPAENSAIN